METEFGYSFFGTCMYETYSGVLFSTYMPFIYVFIFGITICIYYFS